ncbi:helix-turn-helix transcriptional regulator [Enterocloster aldenensis]|uniref:helix-turn-helix transcriptional regulator n=1 Tax=Enterocloster aldenensis TaxID=358742 RepID=UPI004025A0E6
MNTDILNLFSQIVQAHHVNCLQVEPDLANLYKADMELRYKLYSDYDYGGLESLIQQDCRVGEIIRLADDFSLIIYIIRIGRASLSPVSRDVVILAGPVLEAPPTLTQIQRIMARKKLPDNLQRELQAFYNNVPVPADLKAFEAMLVTIADNLFGVSHTFCTIPDHGSFTLESVPGSLHLKESPTIAMSSIEERYEVEDQMLDAIASGNQDKAIRYYTLFKTYRITPRTDNALINRKNMMIIFNTLCRKSVQKGHVHPVYIDDLSTRFAIRINQARSMSELDAIDNEMVHKYCLLVRNHSMKNYSQIVQRCITYTDFHYAEPLTLAFFAEMCHVTKSYLSALFKKETGGNLTDYIHSIRIRHSLLLLNSTTLPVHVVAAGCGYTDVNYFIKIFKRIHGISPKQYRSRMNKE